jgi:hypothetical protein
VIIAGILLHSTFHDLLRHLIFTMRDNETLIEELIGTDRSSRLRGGTPAMVGTAAALWRAAAFKARGIWIVSKKPSQRELSVRNSVTKATGSCAANNGVRRAVVLATSLTKLLQLLSRSS